MNKNNDGLFSENEQYKNSVLKDFKKRCQEIELFFDFMWKFEEDNPKSIPMIFSERYNALQKPLEKLIIERKHSSKLSANDLLGILYANAVLLLYNLMESTISNADKFIVEQINAEELLYDQVSNFIQVIAVEQKEIKKTVKKFIEQFIKIKEQTFSGNIDSKRIDSFMEKYGVKTTEESGFKDYEKRKYIENIKDWRNDLAHGKLSFSRLSQDQKLTYDLIKEHKKSCFEFLEIVLKNIETFMQNACYKSLVNII